MPPQLIRIVIADDHLVVRSGLRFMLATSDEFVVVGEAVDGQGAVDLVEQLLPDVVLMDLRMPTLDGWTAIKRIRQHWPSIAVVVLTTYNEDDLVIRALQAGAQGYLLKDCSVETLQQTLRAAAHGEVMLQPEVVARLVSHAAQGLSPTIPAASRDPLDLTDREREVLAGVAQGERNKEIALRLGISERTVGSYIATIFAKLGVDSRASAVAQAIERKIL